MSSAEATFCGDYCGKCPIYEGKCQGYIPAMHMDCHFVKCCPENGVEHCSFCKDLSCKRLQEFVPDGRPKCQKSYHIEKLRVLKAVGTDEWLKLQRV